MSKKIMLIIIMIMAIGGIAYILIPKEQKEKIENTISSIGETTTTSTKTDNLMILSKGKTNDCHQGYYYIHMATEKSNIKYFDYATKKEIYLCNKPNCQHDTEKCYSYLPITGESEIFVYQNHLYLISSTTEIKEIETEENGGLISGTESQTPPVIYQMNLDGTNKTKLFECPSGTNIIPCAIAENTIYAFFTKNENIATGINSTTQMETERKLVEINTKTGKYEEIADSKNQSVLGVYKHNLIIEEIEYKQDPQKFLKDDNGAISNMKNSTKKIIVFNLDTRQTTELYRDVYKNMETIDFAGEQIYFMDEKSEKIQYINVETKETGILIHLPKAGATFQGIYDNHLQYVYYDESSDEAKIDKAYVVDLVTKENKEFLLLDNHQFLVEILAQNDEYYFVRTGYEMTAEYTTWAGTKQRDIAKTNYGLIKKEDYWQSKANYITMKNIEN